MRQYLTQFLLNGGAALVLSAAARALPDPVPSSSRVYLWFFVFANLLLVNKEKLDKSKLQRLGRRGLKKKKLL